jgi:hypothetical protein
MCFADMIAGAAKDDTNVCCQNKFFPCGKPLRAWVQGLARAAGGSFATVVTPGSGWGLPDWSRPLVGLSGAGAGDVGNWPSFAAAPYSGTYTAPQDCCVIVSGNTVSVHWYVNGIASSGAHASQMEAQLFLKQGDVLTCANNGAARVGGVYPLIREATTATPSPSSVTDTVYSPTVIYLGRAA